MNVQHTLSLSQDELLDLVIDRLDVSRSDVTLTLVEVLGDWTTSSSVRLELSWEKEV